MQYISHAELGAEKQTVTDYRLGTVKVKSRNDQARSLFPLSSLFSGKEKAHSSFFLFTAALSYFGFICISLIANDGQYLFMCLFSIPMPFSVKCLFMSFSHFL